MARKPAKLAIPTIDWNNPTVFKDLVAPPQQRAAQTFEDFVRHVDPWFQWSEWHKRVAVVFDKWVRGTLPKRNLIVIAPVRHGKSVSGAQLLPSYSMGCRANDRVSEQVLSISFGIALASRNSDKVRQYIRSQEYAGAFPGLEMRKDNSEEFQLWRNGREVAYYHCAGIEGAITGYGAHRLIIDDPIRERENTESRKQRDKVWDRLNSSVLTRLMPDYAALLIMSRWHPDDPAGRFISQMRSDPKAIQWHIICLPAVLDEAAYEDEVFQMAQRDVLPDWRQKGESLWPEWWPPERLEMMKSNPYDWDSLYQGRPRSPETRKLNPAWFLDERKIDADSDEGKKRLESVWRWVRGIDLAVRTDNSHDHTASVKVGLCNDGMFIIAQEEAWRATWPNSRRRILGKGRAEGPRVELAFGRGGQQGGFIDGLKDDPEFSEFLIHAVSEQGCKVTRANEWADLAEAGRILMVKGSWNDEWLKAVEDFTGEDDPFDDPLDAFWLAFKVLAIGSPSLIVYRPPEQKTSDKEHLGLDSQEKHSARIEPRRSRWFNANRRQTYL